MGRIIDILKRACKYIVWDLPVSSPSVIAQISYLQPNNRLIGKKIIVTGGGKGIGYSMAKRFVSEGAAVLIAGRNEELLRHSSEQLGCSFLKLDLTEFDSFDSFIKESYAILGGIDCLVNNAGISLHEESFLEVERFQYETQFDINLKGPFFLTQSFMRFCDKCQLNDNKNILFITSETGTTVDERPYGLSKAALNSLIQGLAHKYLKKGYRINAIAPGVTLTDMVGGGDINGDLSYGQLSGRYFLPDEIAEVASFLLSDASRCINGQILYTNAGNTINARWR